MLLEALYTPTMRLMHACARGDTKLAAMLLEDEQVDPTAHRNFALRSSLEFGHIAIVRLLLDDGYVEPADIDDDTIERACENLRWIALHMILYPKSECKSFVPRTTLPLHFVRWRSHAKRVVDRASRRHRTLSCFRFTARLCLAGEMYRSELGWYRFLLIILLVIVEGWPAALPRIAEAYKLTRDTSLFTGVRALWDELKHALAELELEGEEEDDDDDERAKDD